MKYLKKFNEALLPSQFRKYVNEFNKDRYSEIFKEIGDKYEHDKNYYRVYIPLDKEKITGYISDIHKEVDKFLKENDCELIDYIKGKAKFNNSKNETTIGKLLTRLKNDKLNIAFQSDEKRKTLTSTEKEDLFVVISRHPYDIAGSDTDRNWTNCMTIGTDKSNRLTKLMDEYEKTNDKKIKRKIEDYKEDGSNVTYLIHEVKEGSLISYLVKSDDKNINNPLGVLNIKPYTKDDEVMLYTSSNMYGISRPEFKNTVDNILSEYFNKNIKGGKYHINKNVYNDRDGIRLDFSGLSIDEICKTLNIQNYTINNGLVDIDGSVELHGLTKLPLNFGNVTKHFDIRGNQLTSLEGSPKSVGGLFCCSNNNLTSLEGAPENVGAFRCEHNQLTSLEGSPKNIKYYFYCHYNQLTSLQGGPKSVGEEFWCYDNKLTTLEGAPENVGNFDCSSNQLTSLEGAPKNVDGYFFCTNNKLTSLEGKPKNISGEFRYGKNPIFTKHRNSI